MIILGGLESAKDTLLKLKEYFEDDIFKINLNLFTIILDNKFYSIDYKSCDNFSMNDKVLICIFDQENNQSIRLDDFMYSVFKNKFNDFQADLVLCNI